MHDRECLIWYIDHCITKWPHAHWDCPATNIAKKKCSSSLSLSLPGEAVLISHPSCSVLSNFSSKIKLGGHWSERQRAQRGWAMGALLSDVKISSLTPPVAVEIWWAKVGNGSKKDGSCRVASEWRENRSRILSRRGSHSQTAAAPLEMHLRCHGCIYSRVAALIGMETVYDGFLNNACT